MKEKIRRIWKPLAITLILSVAIWSTSLTKPVHAQPPIMTTFKAAEITGNPGDIRTVTVNVYNAGYFWGWQVYMTWDPTVLNFVILTFGDFLAGQPLGTVQNSMTDYVSDGWFMCSEVSYGDDPGVGNETDPASGWLMSVAFEILTLADSPITIDSIYTYWMDDVNGPTAPWGDDGVPSSEMIKEDGALVMPWDEDINVDGIVDVMDLAYVAINYGKGPGDTIDPPRADVNGDGYVNIVDLSMVAIKYGQYTGY